MRLKTVSFFILLSVTVVCAGPIKPDSTSRYEVEDTNAFVMKKSPWKAVLFSAVVPGTGQIYNHSYWKAPLVWGLSTWFIYYYIQNNKSYKDYQQKYRFYLQKYQNSLTTADPVEAGNQNNYNMLQLGYRQQREDARGQRDDFAVYLGLTYVLTLVDAYVDAQMFDFGIGDGGTGKTINFRYYFNR